MTEAGSPFVSTFEGPDWADNWNVVRHETGGIFLVPDWSSLGPCGVGENWTLLMAHVSFPASWFVEVAFSPVAQSHGMLGPRPVM